MICLKLRNAKAVYIMVGLWSSTEISRIFVGMVSLEPTLFKEVELSHFEVT